MVDQANHVESVGDDHGFGKLLLYNRTVDRRQVHTDHPNLLFPFQGKEIRLQRRLRAAEGYIVDAMVLQIAKRRGIALFAREEMLVDAQYLRANERMVLARATFQAP